jgi:hypothetical protein
MARGDAGAEDHLGREQEAAMWKRTRPDDGNAEFGANDGGLGDECEAYLRGEWAEFLLASGQGVPRWAWLNRVAHGPEKALRLMHRGPAWWGQHEDAWTEFRSPVVELLLKQAEETGRTVEEIQAGVLVPIELALFARDESRLPADAVLLVRVLAALRDPSAQSGPPAD